MTCQYFTHQFVFISVLGHYNFNNTLFLWFCFFAWGHPVYSDERKIDQQLPFIQQLYFMTKTLFKIKRV